MNEDIEAQLEAMKTELAAMDERRKGARRDMRLALLHGIPDIEASLRSEFGPASPSFDGARRFSEAMQALIEAVSLADED